MGLAEELDDAIAQQLWDLVRKRAARLFSLWDEDPNPRFGASRAARALGMSESALSDLLTGLQLPPYGLLHEWYLVVRMREDAETTSLSRLSWRHGREPATNYRFIKRATRMTWSRLRLDPLWRVRLRAIEAWAPYIGAHSIDAS